MDTVVWTYMGSSGQLGVRKIVELVDTSRCGHLVKCKPAACKCPSHAGRVASTIVGRLRNGPVYFKKCTLSHTIPNTFHYCEVADQWSKDPGTQ